MIARRILCLFFIMAMTVGSVPRLEAAYYCRTTEQRVEACCCKSAANDPCASNDAMATCGCCEVRLTAQAQDEGTAPLVPRAITEPAPRLDAGILIPGSFDLAGVRSAPPTVFSVRSVPRSSPLPLHVIHRVFLC